MLFNSLNFFVFFPIVVLIYFLIPHKIRYIWLLFTSYFFYMCWNPVYALLLLSSTLITYFSALAMEGAEILFKGEEEKKIRSQTKTKKIIVGISFLLNLSMLFYYKYFEFAIDSINVLLKNMNVTLINPGFDIILPVGISFYIFQALSYTMDVYRKNVKVEKNIFRYAVFVSFFPQLVAGPIERSSNLLHQFRERKYFDYNRVRDGLLLMLWGFFQKIVVADRVSILVNQIFDYYAYYSGFYLVVAAVFFAFQVYCDFAGYSNIAIGAAQVLGFDLMKNFDCPYLARSVTEFWRRWHISLTTWFRDYLYIPLGGNRKGKIRKYVNVMIVFLVSGLWHGANWTYVIWGGLNGLYQVIEQSMKPLFQKAIGKTKVKRNVFSSHLLQMIITFFLVDIAWIFFRADTITGAVGFIQRMFSEFNPWILFDGSLYDVGLSQLEFQIAVLAILVLMVVDVLHYKGVQIRTFLSNQQVWFRWMIYVGAISIVLVFGIYGPDFDASQFIYFQF